MNIKLHTGETLKVNEPTEADQIDYLQMLEDYEKERKEKGTLSAQKTIIDKQDRLLAKLCTKTVEEVKKMALVDKNKSIEAIKGRMIVVGPANYNMDF